MPRYLVSTTDGPVDIDPEKSSSLVFTAQDLTHIIVVPMSEVLKLVDAVELRKLVFKHIAPSIKRKMRSGEIYAGMPRIVAVKPG